ncbi:hypothetical protein, partial [Synechococcus lacustris]|uniref:hypothetical protein n=1 Tax=Synechococcus lacustris TaxID=2116544 RepID=UPI0020CD1898
MAAVISVIATSNGKETDGSPSVFSFSRTGDTNTALSVSYQLFGTAQAGSDYTGNTTGTINFAAGSSSATLSLPALADGALIDPYETIIARINASTNYEIATGKQFATATITAEGMVVIPKTKAYWYRNSEEFIKRTAFAALKRDGSVVIWGETYNWGNAPAGLTGVSQIFSNTYAFAALKSDGSVISWGPGYSGGSANTPAGLTGVSQIFSTNNAFAALKSDGSVICWGRIGYGGDAPGGLTGVTQIFSTEYALAALKNDGSVISWGDTSRGGSAPAGLLGVKQIISTDVAFAALKNDGSVISWGRDHFSGNELITPAGLTGVSQIFSNTYAFAALKSDGSVISWGKYWDGAKYAELIAPAGLTGVSQIFSTSSAFAALKSDGSVVSWGNTSSGGVAPAELTDVSQIFSTGSAFAALRSDGSVVCWGSKDSGGVAPAELTDVSQIFFTGSAFAALKSDGSVVCWGSKDSGGVAPAGLTGVSQIFSTSNAFAALKTNGSVISWGGKYYDGSKWVEFIAPAGLTGVVGFANPYTDDRLEIEATPSYTLTPSETSINEGATLTTSVATTNVASGTTLYYSLSGPGITAADFSAGALTGSGTVGTDGKFLLNHTVANDLKTEGAETLEIKLFSDEARKAQVGSTASVSISDTSSTTTREINIASEQNDISIEVDFTDLTGISFDVINYPGHISVGYPGYRGFGVGQNINAYEFSSNDLIKGNSQQGTLRKLINIPTTTPTSQWWIDSISLTDIALNTSGSYINSRNPKIDPSKDEIALFASQIGVNADDLTFKVVNPNVTLPDKDAPKINAIRISNKEINIDNKVSEVIIEVDFTDLTGINFDVINYPGHISVGYPGYRGFGVGQNINAYEFSSNDLIEGNLQQGTLRKLINIPTTTPTSQWWIDSISLTDIALNTSGSYINSR